MYVVYKHPDTLEVPADTSGLLALGSGLLLLDSGVLGDSAETHFRAAEASLYLKILQRTAMCNRHVKQLLFLCM